MKLNRKTTFRENEGGRGMGIIVNFKHGWVESRTQSVVVGMIDRIYPDGYFEVDYKDLDELEELIKLAQKNRRDKEEVSDGK
jgi:hypothetical protein